MTTVVEQQHNPRNRATSTETNVRQLTFFVMIASRSEDRDRKGYLAILNFYTLARLRDVVLNELDAVAISAADGKGQGAVKLQRYEKRNYDQNITA